MKFIVLNNQNMSITKITTPELLDFPNDSTSSANTSGTVIPAGYSTLVSGGGAQLEDSLTLAVSTAYTVTVGDGGTAGGTSPSNGGDSTISGSFTGSPITSTGGGASGTTGGSGGGAFADSPTTIGNGTTDEGYNGGQGYARVCAYPCFDEAGGGGGGAGGLGDNATAYIGGDGGIGIISCIKNPYGNKYAGGGGGGGATTGGLAIPGYGGSDGTGSATPSNAPDNQGGGGGSTGNNAAATAANGGSGVIIIRYPSTISATYSAGAGGVATVNNTISGSTDLYAEITAGTGTIEFTGTPSSFTADYLVLAGGGGGGQDERGGGGAGGIRTSYGINQRPATADAGEFRYNEQLGYVEYYDGSNWQQIADEYITGQPTTCICSYPISGTALYQFEDNANDTCGNYNATAGANITYPTGKFGKAANFPGNLSTPGDGIVLPSSISTVLNNNYSISIWFNADTFATGCISGCGHYPTLIAGFDSLLMYFCVYYNGSNYVLRYYSGGAGTGLDGATTLSTSTWYHAVLTQSSTGGAKIYLNGVLDGSNGSMTANADTTGSGQNLFGGYDSSGSFDLPWNGLMDQIRIYNSVLTATQITELYNEIPCN